MRHEPTVNEERLWALLRDRRLDGLKFRRQVPIGPYIADFVCFQHQLVVEADGPMHNTERDAVRDCWFREKGFRVLRFPNGQVFGDAHAVLHAILAPLGRDGSARALGLFPPNGERGDAPSSDRLRRPPSPTRGEG